MKIDVTIATKNNEETIEKCIQCIKDNIPFNEIIIIDDSDDRTPEIAKRMGARVITKKALLGEKRFLQAKYSNTEWIASIDSDVFVFPNWWETMEKEISTSVGAINSFLESDFNKILPEYERFTKFQSIQYFNKTGKGSTMANNLIKRNLLLKMEKDLCDIHAGEDSIIGRKIKEYGYSWTKITTITGFHYHENPLEHHKMAYIRQGRSIINKKGLKGFLNVFYGFISMNIEGFIFSLKEKKINIKLFKFISILSLCLVKGSLTYKKL